MQLSPRTGALALAGAALLLSGCHALSGNDEGDGGRRESAADFPKADRPVAPIVSTRYASEETRDRLNEANDIMDRAGIRPGMTVADIGAGEGYYTVRLAARVGARGRVLAQDIMAEVIEALGRRITREHWDNVSVKLGTPDDPGLPRNSFDRIMMVHMYHEIEEPYAFLWNMRPALKPDGEVIVVDSMRSIEQHGTPPKLLSCEFSAVGYQLVELVQRPTAGGYLARFRVNGARPEPGEIRACAIAKG